MNTVEALRAIVGKSHVITSPDKSLRYRKGYRSGRGDALAVVLPGTLMELWEVLKVLHDNDLIIIMQASNTSLTEGSIPAPGYARQAALMLDLRTDFSLPCKLIAEEHFLYDSIFTRI